MKKQIVHLISNAHIDPAWLWEWEEGAAVAISTFRTAADLCEEFNGFIFNHNEVILYKWVEEYEPALFKRIQKLVQQKKWYIMGGWYVQPDCNMPAGESFVRQCLIGKNYFKEKFDVDVTTAINFDPFGHTQGLAQILAKSGYNFYVFCRPGKEDLTLPANDFIWLGYDGSKICAKRVTEFYGSAYDSAHQKIHDWLSNNPDDPCGLILWGVGDHGGGPSRIDLKDINKLIIERKDMVIKHSTLDDFLKDLKTCKPQLPQYKGDLNPWAVGCYTSIIRIKQKHRLLENDLYSVEKMVSVAASQGLIEYPRQELTDALEDLLAIEFHDVLPGSHIKPVEEATLRIIDHGLELLNRAKMRAFFALSNGQQKPREGEVPIFVFNPHPFNVHTLIECEFQDRGGGLKYFTDVKTMQNKIDLPTQVEKEASNIPIDWRKKIVFEAVLQPSQINRFDCRIIQLPAKPKSSLKPRNYKYIFKTDDLNVEINTRTGLIDRYMVKGKDLLKKNAFQPIVIQDDEDPWHMRTRNFPNAIGSFKLMDKKHGAYFSGLKEPKLPSVRVIEDGEVRTVIEVLLEYNHSSIYQRYKLPKHGTEIEVELYVYWNEKDRMLKLNIPTAIIQPQYIGQVAYGVAPLPSNGDEAVSHKWSAVVSTSDDRAFAAINDCIYGSDCKDGILRLTLLRSPAFSAHPFPVPNILPQDRFSPRIDQGERLFKFWFKGGKVSDILSTIDREALVKNEKPFALSFFPHGKGIKPQQGPRLSDNVVVLAAFKKAESGNDFIVRLFEPTGKKRFTTLTIPCIGFKQKIMMAPFEIKTLKINPKSKKAIEVNLIER